MVDSISAGYVAPEPPPPPPPPPLQEGTPQDSGNYDYKQQDLSAELQGNVPTNNLLALNNIGDQSAPINSEVGPIIENRISAQNNETRVRNANENDVGNPTTLAYAPAGASDGGTPAAGPGNEIAANPPGASNRPLNQPNPARPLLMAPARSPNPANGPTVAPYVDNGIPNDPSRNAAQYDRQAQQGIGSSYMYQDNLGQNFHVIRTPAPYYTDRNGQAQMLRPGQSAPPNALGTNYQAYQRVTVRELQGNELGDLKDIKGPNDPKLRPLLARVEAQNEAAIRTKINPSTGKNFTSMEDARNYSRAEGYYGSGAHISAANAASARVGGRIPPEWFMQQDPFMGRAGPDQDYFPSRAMGLFPGDTSKIGVGHDADWGLGRNFGAGPMRDLKSSTNPRGDYGLNPFSNPIQNNPFRNVQNPFNPQGTPRNDWYGTGNPEWTVENMRGETTNRTSAPNPPRGPLDWVRD